jgi:hypothetical protein
VPAIVETIATGAQPFGAGSGGDPADGGHTNYHDGAYKIAANQIELWTFHASLPQEPLPYKVSLIASDATLTEGNVEVRGATGVRITSGPPPSAGGPSSADPSTNGVDIVVAEQQKINIMRGLLPDVDQSIVLSPGGITMEGGDGIIKIDCLQGIVLSVGPTSSITLTPTGITLKGLIVQINP